MKTANLKCVDIRFVVDNILKNWPQLFLSHILPVYSAMVLSYYHGYIYYNQGKASLNLYQHCIRYTFSFTELHNG